MITIDLLKQKFIDNKYLISDELLWWTYTKIKELIDNEQTSEIKALGLFGPSGTGKTTYVLTLHKILLEILEYDVILNHFICNYDIEQSIVDNEVTTKTSIINKDSLIDAIKIANENKKVILFIDSYDEVSESVDNFIASFLQTGIVVNDNKEAFKLENKNNLQIIIAGKDNTKLLDQLIRRIDSITTENYDAETLLDYFIEEYPNIDKLVIYTVIILYYRLSENYSNNISRIPTLSELVLALKSVQFMVSSGAKLDIIANLMIESLVKSMSDDDVKDGMYDILDRIFEDETWDRKDIASNLYNLLDSYDDFEGILEKKVSNVIDEEAEKEEYSNQNEEEEETEKEIKVPFSLVNSVKKDIVDVNDPKLAQAQYYTRSRNAEYDWIFSYMIETQIHKWHKLVTLRNVNSETLDKSLHRCAIQDNLILHTTYDGVNKKFFNRIILCKNPDSNDYSVYSSEPIISCGVANKILDIFKNVYFDSGDINLPIYSRWVNQRGPIIDEFETDSEFKNAYYLKRDGIINNTLYYYQSHLSSAFEELIIYDNGKMNNYYYIIPTRRNIDKKVKTPIFKSKADSLVSKLSLGGIKLLVTKCTLLKDNPYEHHLTKIVDRYIIDNCYGIFKRTAFNIPDYNLNSLFLVYGKYNLGTARKLSNGVYLLNGDSRNEFIAINPNELPINEETYNEEMCKDNKVLINKL